jgi:acetate kinase
MSPISFLTVNAGSSSIRLDLLQRVHGGFERLATLHHATMRHREVTFLRAFMREHAVQPDAILHRIVHGGGPITHGVFDARMRRRLIRAFPLDPLHLPASLKWISACTTVLGSSVPQVCVFDSAFFADLPFYASEYALPRGLIRRFGIRRLGFHGLAHQSMLRQLRQCAPDASKGRILTLQLGSGCSAAAIKNGKPIDTSMGFTPLEGLVMSTRSGDVDPGLLMHLLKHRKIPLKQLDALLNKDSGLRGLAGTGDMAQLCKRNDTAARHAIAIFSYRVRKYIGAYAAALGGVDAIAIAGGIGEHSAQIRGQILTGWGWLGLELDRRANSKARGGIARVSAPNSRVAVWVLRVDEATEMAHAALPILAPL